MPPTDTLVLCYHAISPTWTAKISVTPDALRGQLRKLLSRGYRPVTFADAAERRPRGRTLAVTFDDAYRSVLVHGAPVLRELGVPATVFACTDYVGLEQPMPLGLEEWGDTPDEGELVPMSWSDLAGLGREGWEIGSHTRTHPNLKRLEGAALEEELRGSKTACEQALGVPCRSLAYPYGDHDRRTVEAVRRAGYVAAATTFPGWIRRPPPLEWPRVCVNRHHDGPGFALKTAPQVRRFRASKAGDALTGLAYRRRSGTAPRRPAEDP